MKRIKVIFTLGIMCALASSSFASQMPMTAASAYRILNDASGANINAQSSYDAIEKAYRKAARKYHPDMAQGKEQSEVYEERFKDIVAAYEFLAERRPDRSAPSLSAEQERAQEQANQDFKLAQEAYYRGDYASAIDILSKLTRQDTSLKGISNLYLAQIYLIGNDDIRKDNAKARQYAQAALDNNVASAQEIIDELTASQEGSSTVAVRASDVSLMVPDVLEAALDNDNAGESQVVEIYSAPSSGTTQTSASSGTTQASTSAGAAQKPASSAAGSKATSRSRKKLTRREIQERNAAAMRAKKGQK